MKSSEPGYKAQRKFDYTNYYAITMRSNYYRKQGRKRPLDTPKKMREGEREKERYKERYREGGRDMRERERE